MLPTVVATCPAERVLDVPLIPQERPLSCEFAAMRMVLATLLGRAPTEDEVMSCVPRDANPHFGFRGDPGGRNRNADGSINWENYGVYAPAVASALNACFLGPNGKFEAIAATGVTYSEVADSILHGYPVIVWVATGQPETVGLHTPEGEITLVAGEHVWVVYGYHANNTFDVLDPYPVKSGRRLLARQAFPNWRLFENMAVFIVPQ